MAAGGQWPDDSMFQHFNVLEETYKTVGSHDIKTGILIPKNLKPGPHPLIINIHGGWLMYGHGLLAAFFAPWVLKLALENSAITVSPDYQLLPSANGLADMNEDFEDFWKWTRKDLVEILRTQFPEHSIDFSHLLVTGSSAGGYCAMQMAISHPDEISAVAVSYPFVDLKDEVIMSGPGPNDPTVFRFPLEDLPSKGEVLQRIEEEKKAIRTQGGLDMTPFAVAATQYGLLYSHIIDTGTVDPMNFIPLEEVKAGARLPKRIWIQHGDADSILYLRATQRFVKVVREMLPDTIVRLDVAKGEEHAYDLCKTSWELHAIGALDFVKNSWLETSR